MKHVFHHINIVAKLRLFIWIFIFLLVFFIWYLSSILPSNFVEIKILVLYIFQFLYFILKVFDFYLHLSVVWAYFIIKKILFGCVTIYSSLHIFIILLKILHFIFKAYHLGSHSWIYFNQLFLKLFHSVCHFLLNALYFISHCKIVSLYILFNNTNKITLIFERSAYFFKLQYLSSKISIDFWNYFENRLIDNNRYIIPFFWVYS